MRSKLKNFITGNTVDRTWRAGESVEVASVNRSETEFTYAEGDEYVFMDMTSFEEMRIPWDEDWAKYLKEVRRRAGGRRRGPRGLQRGLQPPLWRKGSWNRSGELSADGTQPGTANERSQLCRSEPPPPATARPPPRAAAQGMKVGVLVWNGKVISVDLPMVVELEVTETDPGLKGNTAGSGGSKPATLETGAVVQVPLFISIGEKIKVDTRTDSYQSRA